LHAPVLLPLARVHRSFWPWHRSHDWRLEAVEVDAVVVVVVVVAAVEAAVEVEGEAILE
jgi:hypothetical protein